MNGSRLAGLYCQGLKVTPYSDIDVEFDDRLKSDKMRVQRFSGSDNAYIPSSQPTYSGQLPYDEFLRRLTKANKVALQLNLDGGRQQWITFALTGSGTALAKIGAVRADSEPRRPSAAPAKTVPQA